jgi:RNA-directed DNA polymerase
MRFTALLHHIYDLNTLRAAYRALKREAAAGVDGETWRHYGERLEENLRDLAARVKRGAYRAKGVQPQGRRAATTARSDRAGR